MPCDGVRAVWRGQPVQKRTTMCCVCTGQSWQGSSGFAPWISGKPTRERPAQKRLCSCCHTMASMHITMKASIHKQTKPLCKIGESRYAGKPGMQQKPPAAVFALTYVHHDRHGCAAGRLVPHFLEQHLAVHELVVVHHTHRDLHGSTTTSRACNHLSTTLVAVQG